MSINNCKIKDVFNCQVLSSRRLTLFNIAVLKEGKPQQSRNDLIQPKPGLLMIKSSPDALIWLIWLRANPVAASLTRPQMGQSSIPETWRGFCFTLESCFWRESGWKVAWPLISLHCSFERACLLWPGPTPLQSFSLHYYFTFRLSALFFHMPCQSVTH